nr:MAG TPA: antirepressor protein [Caudoviricetes sp.]
MMKEIIRIETTSDGKQAVSARELHKFLEVGKDFSTWFKDRVEKYDFVENQDFILLPKIGEQREGRGGHNIKEYAITLEMAKELCMIENNEQGRKARRYFIECEKKLKENVTPYIPKTFAQALRAYADEVEKNEQLRLEVGQQKQVISELQPKATYYDLILSSVDCLTVTQIAKDYGMTAQSLNQFLFEKKVQFKQSGTWLLYQNHADKGYTKSETVPITYKNGERGSKLNTKWTQKGRLFLYQLLKNNNILPLMERYD